MSQVGNMSQVFGTPSCFFCRSFLKQLASHVSGDTYQVEFPGVKFLLIDPGNLFIYLFFLEGFKIFCVHKKIIAHKRVMVNYDGKIIFL